jgi:HAE1 family hydrophobic/amphiphilic exporter-1
VDGSPVRLKDVARVLDGQENPYAKSWYKGDPAILLAVFRQPGSNTVGVIDAIRKVLPQFQANLPPSVTLDVVFDRSQMIRASINDVQHHLIIAGFLVVGVIFVFLRRLSATHHPVAGAAHHHHRHLRGHGGLRFQPGQSVVDGADAVGRLCGR